MTINDFNKYRIEALEREVQKLKQENEFLRAQLQVRDYWQSETYLYI